MKNYKLKKIVAAEQSSAIRISKAIALPLLITSYFLLSTSCLYASNEGTATATFLKLEQGARPIGMGGAFVGISDSADGLYYNPAGIAQLARKEVSFTYSSMYQDIMGSFLSFAIPTEKSGSFGLAITYLTVDKIEKTNAAGASLGDTNIYNLAAAVYYAKKLNEISLGGGMKFIQQDYDAAKGTGIAADIGGLISIIKDKLSLGLSVVNIGPETKIGDVKNKLPLNIRGGVGFNPIKTLTFGVDLEKPNDADNKIHIGGEYAFNPSMAVRVGYETMKDVGGGLTAGVGIKSELGGEESFFGSSVSKKNLMLFCLDYAYVSFGDLEATHRISVGLKF
ncbi:MAG: PorV/PorQ family protein [Elusimicrobiota bacterium]|nr:PorV/PorQ family protein [Elusimicrobiota bacterium]